MSPASRPDREKAGDVVGLFISIFDHDIAVLDTQALTDGGNLQNGKTSRMTRECHVPILRAVGVNIPRRLGS